MKKSKTVKFKLIGYEAEVGVGFDLKSYGLGWALFIESREITTGFFLICLTIHFSVKDPA